MLFDGLPRILRAARIKTAARRRPQNEDQYRRNKKLIETDAEAEAKLNDIHAPDPLAALFQTRLTENAHQVVFDLSQLLAGNGRTCDQHQVHRFRQTMLMQAKAFAQQTASPAAHHGAPNLPARDNAKTARLPRRTRQDIGNQTAADQSAALGLGAGKFTPHLEAAGTRKGQTRRWRLGHAIERN